MGAEVADEESVAASTAPESGTAETDPEDKDKALDPSIKLISYAGKDALKAAMDAVLPDREKVFEFIRKFRTLRRINISSTQPALELLEMGGLTGHRRSRAILTSMREAMKRHITTLDQEQLETLLNHCYSYLTIPELAAVPIATLERMTYVDPAIWNQIVENGLDESPYTDLPVSIKRRIWVSEMAAFDHEVGSILKRVPELPPMDISEFQDRKRRKQRPESPLLHELMRMTQGLSEELIAQAVEKMVEAAGESSTQKRIAIANLFHDFMVRLTPRANSNMAILQRIAIFLESVENIDIDPAMLEEIREALSTSSSCGPVALLVGSTYSRDFLADQLIVYLLNRRGAVPNIDDETSLAAAALHVKEDPVIPNLTYLCFANMKADLLITRASVLNPVEVEQPFEVFYPLMIHEMHADVTQSNDMYFSQNATVPSDALQELVRRGRLERRVLTSYCLQLYTLEIAVGLARFRLLLDIAFGACDATEETREVEIASSLIGRIIQT